MGSFIDVYIILKCEYFYPMYKLMIKIIYILGYFLILFWLK